MEAQPKLDPLITRALPGSPWEQVPQAIKDFDENLRSQILDIHGAENLFWRLISWITENPVGIALSFVVFLFFIWRSLEQTHTAKKSRWIVLISFIVLSLASDAFSSFLKDYFGRLKPHVNFVNTIWWEYKPALSFPSNHALNSAFQCFCLWSYLRVSHFTHHKKVLLFFLLPLSLLVAYSRVVLGQHYPIDVTAGFLIGSLVGSLAGMGLARIRK